MTKRLNVLVTGATGKQGGALARQLLDHEHNVRAMTRDPDKRDARALEKMGAKIVRGNLEDPASVQKAAEGVDVAFLVTTPYENGVEAEAREGLNGVDALVAAQVPHMVFASVSDADKDTGVPHFDSKRQVERHLEAQDVDHTILAPVFFRENLVGPGLLDGLKEGRLALPMPRDRALQNVSITELGALYCEVVEHHDEYVGQRIDIASDDTTPADMAKSLGDACGRAIEVVEVPLEQARKQSEDMALMFEWFDDKGYTADIEGLRERFPNVPWTDFNTWAWDQDWADLRVTQPTQA